MAGKKSRLDLRREAEAAEKLGTPATPAAAETPKKKKEVKKKAAPRAKRVKVKATVRKRLLWGVFSSSMKEEGRFAYADKDAAEARAAALIEKHKRTFFVQPIKEPVAERTEAAAEAPAAP